MKTLSDIQNEISAWESENLQNGRYIGPPLKGWENGEWIPTSERYSAMIGWKQAMRQNSKL